MLKIEKNGMILTVPTAAYENLYEKNGWKSVDEKTKKSDDVSNSIVENVEENVVDSDDVSEETEDEIDIESMTKSQLKRFAAERNIDISEATNRSELLNIIQAALEE